MHPIDVFNVGVAMLKEMLEKDAKRTQRAVDALELFDAVTSKELSAKWLCGIVALTRNSEPDGYIANATDILKCLVAIDEAGPNLVTKEVAKWARDFVPCACVENFSAAAKFVLEIRKLRSRDEAGAVAA